MFYGVAVNTMWSENCYGCPSFATFRFYCYWRVTFLVLTYRTKMSVILIICSIMSIISVVIYHDKMSELIECWWWFTTMRWIIYLFLNANNSIMSKLRNRWIRCSFETNIIHIIIIAIKTFKEYPTIEK